MELATTRRALHAVAELVLAGPQYRSSQTIRLRVVDGGVGTVNAPDLRIVGGVVTNGEVQVPIGGATCASIAAAFGLEPHPLGDVYSDTTGVPADQQLEVDGAAAAQLTAAFVAGDAALSEFAPESARVVWPEHFDVGVSLDEVNYGVSPGDSFLDEPYAYVGPFVVPEGPFWNAPFGATLPLGDKPDPAAILAFFLEGRAQAAH